MNLFRVAFKSLLNRSFVVGLTVLCISLSVVLLLTLEKIKRSSEEGFTQTVSQVDLLVGARSGQLQLLLFSVFNIGNPTNNVSWKSYQYWKFHPAVDWTIPYSLGDSYQGFRVVGTNTDFFKHYRFRQDQAIGFFGGQAFQKDGEVVVGHEVYKKLKLKVGDPAVITHGVTKGAGVVHHDDKPFRVVGIMKPTGTALDHSVYVSLGSMAHLHEPMGAHDEVHDEHHHSDESGHHHDDEPEHGHDIQHDHEVASITSFFVRTKNRMDTLQLKREISDYSDEPLMAVIPAMALSELWKNLSYFENILQVIIGLVALFSLITLMLMMLASMEARRREMSLLRTLGASSSLLFQLLCWEALTIGFMGVVGGFFISRLGLLYFVPVLKEALGLQLTAFSLEMNEVYFMLAILVGSVVVSFYPGWRVSRQVLKDGLTQKI